MGDWLLYGCVGDFSNCYLVLIYFVLCIRWCGVVFVVIVGFWGYEILFVNVGGSGVGVI